MMQAAYRAVADGRVHVFDASALPWQDTPEPGLRLKPVRYDDERGHFLGLVGFRPLSRSGLHQHRGVATSFVAEGGLSDYNGPVLLHQAGINLVGATHDAFSYTDTVLVSRLEGPVVYPPDRAELSGLHAGSQHASFVNPAPDAPPEINVSVDRIERCQTGIAGVCRQTIFDYAGTGSAHRFVQLSFAPGSACPPFRAERLIELWIRGGLLDIDGRSVQANCFVIVEPGATVTLSSPYGALLLAWAEGPEDWVGGMPATRHAATVSLFGF